MATVNKATTQAGLPVPILDLPGPAKVRLPMVACDRKLLRRPMHQPQSLKVLVIVPVLAKVLAKVLGRDMDRGQQHNMSRVIPVRETQRPVGGLVVANRSRAQHQVQSRVQRVAAVVQQPKAFSAARRLRQVVQGRTIHGHPVSDVLALQRHRDNSRTPTIAGQVNARRPHYRHSQHHVFWTRPSVANRMI